jgi:release factor glutamine methyltransferase
MNNYIRDNRVATLRHYLKVELLGLYDAREAEQIVKILFQHYLGWSSTQIMLNKEEKLSESEILLLHQALKRLKQGMPVQYAIGCAYFMDMSLKVSPAVLIPRPETEELVRLISEDYAHQAPTILDVGTGSGCIGLGLKKHLPASQVTLLDTSSEALAIAEHNAQSLQLDVQCIHADIMHYRSEAHRWDVIVSNPPYIPLSEKQEMAPNVVNHEPHLALFVTDQEPLIFYWRIIQIARIALRPGGKIYFEIHERMGESIRKLCLDSGLTKLKIIKDMQGKDRMIVVG